MKHTKERYSQLTEAEKRKLISKALDGVYISRASATTVTRANSTSKQLKNRLSGAFLAAYAKGKYCA
ncbi:hypothetical protein CWI69_00795 [Pseudidiomarina halophila]|uniref:Uncharacterized protein n=1 Tax=Pseudidiomarina halophila TaxID=1449799 RepID=A0A432XZE5_9GAMM|nr:hypothetical protein CWI69_00795 [Pseudidiomarina halophila]